MDALKVWDKDKKVWQTVGHTCKGNPDLSCIACSLWADDFFTSLASTTKASFRLSGEDVSFLQSVGVKF